jgi:hypothetical protein
VALARALADILLSAQANGAAIDELPGERPFTPKGLTGSISSHLYDLRRHTPPLGSLACTIRE